MCFRQIIAQTGEEKDAEYGQLFMIESQLAMDKRMSRLPKVRHFGK
jgi:hypothetical protein